jgi:hypothetical protein
MKGKVPNHHAGADAGFSLVFQVERKRPRPARHDRYGSFL